MTQPTQKDLDRATKFLLENEPSMFGSWQIKDHLPKLLSDYVLHMEQLGVIKFCENRYNETERRTRTCPDCNGTGYKGGGVRIGGSDCPTCQAWGRI